jgi:hypothetical protein
MEDWPNSSPRSLREQAEKCFRLAQGTTDDRTHDALVTYGEELWARAERMEAVLERAGVSSEFDQPGGNDRGRPRD